MFSSSDPGIMRNNGLEVRCLGTGGYWPPLPSPAQPPLTRPRRGAAAASAKRLRFALVSGGLLFGARRINFVGQRSGCCKLVREHAQALANRDRRCGGRWINYAREHGKLIRRVGTARAMCDRPADWPPIRLTGQLASRTAEQSPGRLFGRPIDRPTNRTAERQPDRWATFQL